MGNEEWLVAEPEAKVPARDVGQIDQTVEEARQAAEQLREMAPGKERTKLGQLLVERGMITEEELTKVLGVQLGIPYVALSTYQIQPEALRLVSESMARKYNVLPLAITNNCLQVATADADDVLMIEALSMQTRMKIKPVLAVADQIQKAIDRNYENYGEIEKQFNVDPAHTLATGKTNGKTSAESIASAPAVRALDCIIDEAIKSRASDIHIEPDEDMLYLRYRIDGVLHDIATLPSSANEPLISRLKILANMNIADHRPQDGQFQVKTRGKKVDIRVATICTAYGEMGVLRVLDRSSGILSLSELGFLPDSIEQYKQMLRSPFGMILISGPTGSGKTTSLYASLSSIDRRSRNIITIEDPIEYHLKGINQIQVNPRTGLTFATGLRSMMRHDPDVILVGEIRDSETAEIAVRAALTGHLVLASVHANDTVGALFRLIDLNVEPFLVASSLIGVVAQRMVRRVCHHCQHPSSVSVEAQLVYNKEMGEERTEFFYGSGCNACSNTGYLGRIAIFEMLNMTEEIRALLLTKATAAQMRAKTEEEGMASMCHDGMLKVKSGVTTPCEVVHNVFSIG